MEPQNTKTHDLEGQATGTRTPVPGATSVEPGQGDVNAPRAVKRLSGAQRRKLRKSRGTSGAKESAVAEASAPEGNLDTRKETESLKGGAAKRPLPSTSTPSPDNERKRAKWDALRPRSFAQAANAKLRGAIAGKNFPAELLSAKQAADIELAMERKIDDLPEGTRMPRFDEWKWSEQGVILITCADQETKDWIKSSLSELGSATALIFLESEQIPKRKKVGCLGQTTSEGIPQFLGRLSRQNPGLNTKLWKIHDRAPSGKKMRLIMGIDEESFRVLSTNGWVAYAGVHRVQFWNLESGQKPHASTSAAPGLVVEEPRSPGSSTDEPGPTEK